MVSKNLNVCLSVVNSNPNYLRTGKKEWAKKKFKTSMAKSHISKFLICPKSGWKGRGRGPKQQHFDQISQLFDKGSG